jgi:hypothetical protein
MEGFVRGIEHQISATVAKMRYRVSATSMGNLLLRRMLKLLPSRLDQAAH